jgi:hypothetical protein
MEQYQPVCKRKLHNVAHLEIYDLCVKQLLQVLARDLVLPESLYCIRLGVAHAALSIQLTF